MRAVGRRQAAGKAKGVRKGEGEGERKREEGG